jgi:hypothetical protein
MNRLTHTLKIAPALLLGLVLAAPTLAAPIDVLKAGASPADIQVTVDKFRILLGSLNPNTPANFADGRREINWDAVPDARSDPNNFPSDFFNGNAAPRARGVVFQATGSTTGFQVSSNAASGVPVTFGQPNFQVFSPERLFRTVGGNSFEIHFFSPFDQVTPGLSDGFGMVYTDVESAGEAPVLTFYDHAGAELWNVTGLQTGRGGLGFVGTLFDSSIVAKVRVNLGTTDDEAVMDDFIYGEPLPAPASAPEPAAYSMLLGGLALLTLRRRKQTAPPAA